jgi:hypothetical protein
MTQGEMKRRLLEVAKQKRRNPAREGGCYCVVCLCGVDEETFLAFDGFCWLCAVRIALGEMSPDEHPDDHNHGYQDSQ